MVTTAKLHRRRFGIDILDKHPTPVGHADVHSALTDGDAQRLTRAPEFLIAAAEKVGAALSSHADIHPGLEHECVMSNQQDVLAVPARSS
jgi:hypothetical protein